MSRLLESVDSRTNLVGQNRLELLMFKLKGRQVFAINVFKVQEVLQLPPLRSVPHSHPAICGVAHIRDRAVPVIDLNLAIGCQSATDRENCNLIVTEYNQSIQGFIVGSVDRIINLNWEKIISPPKTTGRRHFLTAITRVDENIVEIIDVEKVLAEIIPYGTFLPKDIVDSNLQQAVAHESIEILSIDDSSTARSQIKETVASLELNITVTTESDGLKGLNRLKQWADEGIDVNKKLLMVITDAEMPEMDGYRLTHEIRQDPRLKDLFVIMHTSLSGSFNNAMVEKVGCNDFLSKFQPKSLAELIQRKVRERYNIPESTPDL